MKRNNKQSNTKATNKVSNCNKKNANISNKLDDNMKNKKSNNVNGFNDSKSFQLDDDDEHSFEIR